MSRFLSLLILLSCFAMASCDSSSDNENECERSGCDAFDSPAEGYAITTGIAGAAASGTDVVINGCNECPFTQAHLVLFQTPTLFESAEEAEAYLGQGTDHTIVEIDSEYEYALDPGTFLVCADSDMYLPTKCASIELAQGEVFTISTTYINGPTAMNLFTPGADTSTSEGILEVNLTEDYQ